MDLAKGTSLPEHRGPSRAMIGVAISTRNRRAVFNRSLAHWRRRMPPGSVLVVVDDASDDPVPDIDGVTVIRNENRLGVAMTKNRCITALMDAGCDDLFLADDDTHPVHVDWWEPYIRSPEPHLSYQWPNTGWRRGQQGPGCADGKHFTVIFPRGVMLYVQRNIIDIIGGMDPAYGAWGGEHVEWQHRIHDAGFTTWPYADVLGSENLFYETRTSSSFNSSGRRRILECNGVQWQKPRPRFVPFREGNSVQDFTYGPHIPDPAGRRGATRAPVLEHVLALQPTGMALEFGVGNGTTARMIAERMPLIGFDSGKGLPERWMRDSPRGSFACPLPAIDNATMVEGWFADTLPGFDFAQLGYIGLVHIDCDLYSSTKTVFDHVGPYLSSGTYIVFDEYWDFEGEGTNDHEQKAWREFAGRTKIGWTVIGSCEQQHGIRIT